MDKIHQAERQPRRIFAIVGILVIVALLASVMPLFTQQAAAATCSNKYTVVSGDTLSSIAAKYNTTVQVLAELNDLTAPYVLSVGQVLCLPANAKAATATPKTTATSSSKYKYDMSVNRSGTRITLKVSSFPTKSHYWVRAGKDLRKSGWTRIGKVHTNKNGAGEATFRLPDNVRMEPSYYLCLKNQVNDNLTCKKFFQTVPVNPNKRPTPTPRP
jgi:LysM repeat protein